MRLAAILSLVLLASTPVSPAEGTTGRPPIVNAIGYEIDLDRLPSPHPRPERSDVPADRPIVVLVGIPWHLIEKLPGQFDWAVLDQIVRSHIDAGATVILNPHGENPAHTEAQEADPQVAPEEGEAPADPWPRFLRELARRYADDVDHYMVGRYILDQDPRAWAFIMKVSSVAIRSQDSGAIVAAGELDLSREAEGFLEAAYAEGLEPYVDAVAVSNAGDLSGIKARLLLDDPAARIWWVGRHRPGGMESAGRLVREFLEGVAQEAALSTFRLDFSDEGRPFLQPVVERTAAGFSPDLTPLVESSRGIRIVTPMGVEVPSKTIRLFDPEEKKVLIVYDAGEGTVRGAQAVMAIDTLDLADPILRDIAAGEQVAVGAYQKDDAAGITRVALPLSDYPLVLEYRRFTSPLFGEEEKLEVTGVRLPSVEEILARHQAFQAAQDATLQNMRADARIEFHFRIGNSGTFDVTINAALFYDPAVGAEWEHLEYFVNGVKWRSNRFPEFPLPQPEKVLTLPLDIALDKRYAYRLVGEDRVAGYECWEIAFEPVVADESLYKGRVWIDKSTHARVQVSSLQTGLDVPIISNDEKDLFSPLRGPEGVEYWLLSRIDGQQVYSTNGRNLILVREVTLSNHVINDEAFVDLRNKAYASDNQMLRETDAGPRYLERTDGGERVVKDELDRDNLFLAGGVFYNRAVDFPIPLAGLNYYNRDLWNRGIQTNVFFAGALLFANLSHPDLFGTGIDGSADAFGQAFPTTDRPVRDGEEVDEEGVDILSQQISLGLGYAFADYWKIKLTGDLEYQVFSKDDETRRGFVMPVDTLVGSGGLEGEFNRKTWSATASIRSSARNEWESWGDPDPNARPPEETIEDSRDYVTYSGTVSKDFFFPYNQKINASITMFGGEDLDRFSKFEFGFFGNRQRGFSGTGIRFTNGVRGRLQYAFNLGEVIRFDAAVDHAQVENAELPEDGKQDFTGIGFSGQTIIGPNLIVSLDWGIAVASDVDEFRGDQEVFLTILRLFK